MLNRLQDVFRCLKKHKVKYLVIGGIAAVLYGVPRATFDLEGKEKGTGRNFIDLLFSSNMIYSFLTKVEPYFYRNINGRK